MTGPWDHLIPAHEQLTAVAVDRLDALAPFVGVDFILAGRRSLKGVCATIVRELADDDPRLAAEACRTVMCAVWADSDPDPEWWSTPLGRLCARSFGDDDSAVTQAVAAAMLGITRGSIAQMIARGTLVRHPERGVAKGSVMRRLARRNVIRDA